MKVSFDFDSTLTLPIIQQLVVRHIKFGDDVHITTSRGREWKWKSKNPDHNKDLFQLADDLGIHPDNICMTNHEDKVYHLEGFDIHYDDDEYEIDLITRSELKCLGVLINYKNYEIW